MVGLTGGVDTILVARSDGVLAGDVRPLVRMNIQVIVEQDGRRESGFAGFGGRHSYEELLGDGKPEKFAREALRQALVNLERSEEHTSELQSLMRISYAVFCLKKKKNKHSEL